MFFKSPYLHSAKLKWGISAFLWLAPLLALPACSHQDNAQYAALTYDYLTPIFFNVSQINVQDLTANTPYPRDISNLSPTPPDVAVTNMVNNRFKARGNSGSALLVIRRASIQESGDNGLYGQINVSLKIFDNNHKQVGSVQASTSHTYEINPHKGDANSRANLYDITQKMMQDLNVELEYQIRNHLEPWIVDATGTPISDAIKTQDLTTQDSTPPISASDNTGNNPAPKSSLPKGDLNAIFPGGVPNAVTQETKKQKPAPATPPKTDHPVGVLGTLPQSALSKKY